MKLKSISSSLESKLRRIDISVAIALCILILDYLASNWIGHFFDDSVTLSIVNKLYMIDSETDEDVKYYNVAYDKQLVAVKDEYGDSIGNIVITNRNVLLKFLEIAEKADYKYIFMDVRFEKGRDSEIDSLLFSKILSMRDLVISGHSWESGYQIADSNLLKKSAFADYKSTYFSGFTKFEYLQNDTASVALRLYRNIDGGDISRVGPLFISNGSLCHNDLFLVFNQSDIYDEEDMAIDCNLLGGEYLKMNTEEAIIAEMKDKILVVGDLIADVHNTYVGDVPGSKIFVRAYKAIHDGRHLVNTYQLIFMLVVYSLCVYCILYAHFIKVPAKIRSFSLRHPLITFVSLLCGWGIVLLVIKIAVFLLFHDSIIITIPSLVFSVLSLPSEYNKFKKELC